MEFNRQEGTVPDVKVEKKRCSECGRMKPLTTLIPAQEENRNTPIDTYRMTWSVAVREFQIDAEGLS
jgi:hypothetical protein